jgi:hypothetical protein
MVLLMIRSWTYTHDLSKLDRWKFLSRFFAADCAIHLDWSGDAFKIAIWAR